jgi:DNA modification methylase
MNALDLFSCIGGHSIGLAAAGIGTTAIAAMREGRKYVCIEKKPEYFEIIENRIAAERGVGTLLEAAQ